MAKTVARFCFMRGFLHVCTPSTVALLLSTEDSHLVTQDGNVVPVCPAVCYFQFHG